jgi:murein L,D-transpeptidase YcbB/YkuD
MHKTSGLLLRDRKHPVLALLVFVGIGAGSWFPPSDHAGEISSAPNAALRDLVASGHLADLRWPDFPEYKHQLTEFYEPTGYAPAWLRDRRPSSQALQMFAAFKNAGRRGLRPDDYDASRWENRIQALEDSQIDPARFDVAVTVCAMRFVSDLRIGRINPKHFNFGLSIESKKYDLPQFLRDRLLLASDVSTLLDGVEPPFAGYRRTQAALVRYTEIASKDDAEKLPVPAKPVNAGQSYSGVPRLVSLLTLLGDLPADAQPPSQIYEGSVVEAVKRFQRRHGLNDDGRLGAETLKQLNVPLSDRVGQLQLALERWRWLPSEFSAPPIIVNIPDFRLRAVNESNAVTLEMRVVVGKAMRTQTPVFSRDMTYVVLRPYWNVPPSILRGEIIPAIQRNRNYIANKNYEVTTTDGDVVTSGIISDDVLADLKAGKLAVRQKPGPKNALGLVKLMFPNEYNVYLHSTPAPELFSRSRRDFSHGCIRVEKPAELAAWALRNNPGWTLDRVEQSMQNGNDNVSVTLTRSIPVFIVYATALAYDNGEVHFYDDIYGHDAKLAAAIAKGYPYH